MNTLPSEVIATIIVSVLSVITITILTAILMYQARRDRKYDEEKFQALIGEMRNSFEHQMYRLSDRLMATESRWQDVNHLLISSQKIQDTERNVSEKVYLSEFLKSVGITQKDLDIERKLVFVLTPFNDMYDDAFRQISDICRSVGLRAIRGDEDHVKGDILRYILRGLVKANIVIVNVDGRNPNVFYELGIAHALDKGTILVTRSVSDLPVDIKSKRVIVYKEFADLDSQLKSELIKVLVSDQD